MKLFKFGASLLLLGSLTLSLSAVTPVAAATSQKDDGVVNPTKLQPWYQPYTSTPLKTTVTIEYVPGYSIAVWTAPADGKVIPGKLLKHGTSWKTFAVSTVGKTVWYNLGGNQWIPATYAHAAGTTNGKTEIMARRDVTVTRMGGAHIVSSPSGKVIAGRTLPTGSKWRSFGYVDNGLLWYDLGGNQWINAQDVK